MDMNLSFSVLTANIISILLIGTLYLANRQKSEYDRDRRLLQQMMVTIGIANISDCCVYYLAGSSNIVIKVLVFLSGSGLFLGNVMIGYLWAKFIMVHMNIQFSDIRRNIYRTIGLISIVLLVINIFYPLARKRSLPISTQKRNSSVRSTKLQEPKLGNTIPSSRMWMRCWPFQRNRNNSGGMNWNNFF